MCLFVCVGGVEALFFFLLVPHQQGEAALQVERRKSHAILNATGFYVKAVSDSGCDIWSEGLQGRSCPSGENEGKREVEVF